MNLDYLLLQINDATFPIGSYTQSFGLETYILQNKLLTEDDVFLYVKSYLLNSFFYTELISANLAYEYGQKLDFDSLVELDEILSATKLPVEIRDASEKLGRRLVKTLVGMNVPFEENVQAFLTTYEKQHIHHASIYGFICGSLNLDRKSAIRLFLYQQGAGTITNAVKTVPLSQVVGQKLLFNLNSVFDECIEKLKSTSIEDVGLSSPCFDIRQMQHEILYSRLYMS